jgi:hypothetical protein
MLDWDLGELYGVETRTLKQAVKRNIARFPKDFMFELSQDEFDNLRSQIVISSWGGTRNLFPNRSPRIYAGKTKNIVEVLNPRPRISRNKDLPDSLATHL